MAGSSQKSETNSQMPEKISLRRGGRVMKDYSTRLMFQAIKNGKLFATDEYSLDGKNWVKLGSHDQLRKYLDKTPANVEKNLEPLTHKSSVPDKPTIDEIGEEPGKPPPNLDKDLQNIADLLKGINTDS
ncbi:MAG: hypothetical protein ACQ9MH_00900 [Nitrospinales bacterium]